MKKTVCLWLAVLLLLSACSRSAVAAWQEQYDLGVRYLSEGNYLEAVLAFTAAIEIDPMQADAYLGLADAYVALGDVESALQALRDGYAATGDARLQARIDKLTVPESTPTTVPTPAPTPEPALADGPDEENGPVYLLTRQAIYIWDGTLHEEWLYQYDAQGYILSMEQIWYDLYDGSLNSSITTYEHTGEYTDGFARCRVIPDRLDYESEEDWLARQREITIYPGWAAPEDGIYFFADEIFINTHALKYPSLRAMVLANGGVLTRGDDDAEGWAYAVYSFDEAGNPVSCVTYNDAGDITGTAVFEWQLLE